MKSYRQLLRPFLPAILALTALHSHAADTTKQIPESLKSWQDWALWDDKHTLCPSPFQDPNQHWCFWPSKLSLEINRNSGHFALSITTFHETWISLPGNREIWPLEVKSNGSAVPVLEHDGKPSLHLAAGTFQLDGTYRWDEMPLRLALPREIGVLSLSVDGKHMDSPAWDAEGFLWLKRSQSEAAGKDFLETKIYRVIEDGIPMWLHTEIEVSVGGKSREEELGSILPQGWQLSQVNSGIPVAVDDKGRMKVQVRTGKWIIRTSAFRLNHAAEFAYAPDAKPAVDQELIAFRALPDFRLLEVNGVPSIDVSQTTFPAKWRDLPVYRWDNKTPFRLDERMRGMGLQKPEGLSIARELWLDENGHGLVFRDHITGHMQQIWRLDIAKDQDLGSVRSNGQGQLITRNPQSGTPGVELRSRNLNLEATGRMDMTKGLSATGWNCDADKLNVSLNLPPGWRLFALFGADWVAGDWLTSWTLLDLFLLLIFSLAVFRLWGTGAGLLAFFAFALAYHEPDAPRYVWLVLLLPLALLRVVPAGRAKQCLVVWKYLAVSALILLLVPFVAGQVQQVLYPQLESTRMDNNFPGMNTYVNNTGKAQMAVTVAEAQQMNGDATVNAPAPATLSARGGDYPAEKAKRKSTMLGYMSGVESYEASDKKNLSRNASNMLYDAKARIQTGPGVPEWKWRTVRFGWNGPVEASQQVHPVLISLTLQRVITLLRITLLLALASVLLNLRQTCLPLLRPAGAALSLSLFLLLFSGMVLPSRANAQLPDKEMLQTLRQRLTEIPDAYPNAADISTVSLTLRDQRITMDVEIHSAIRCAVPLPGRLPAWSPLSVQIDGKADAALRRNDGYLWVVLNPGVHHVHVEGLLPDVTEWEWTFLLKPRHAVIDAPGWTSTGLRPNGIPEQQIFFARKQKSSSGEASYDRQDYHTLAALTRHLELGLVWQIHNEVHRLTPRGKAVSLRVPLLPGEKVLSSNVTIKDGLIDVRIGAQEQSYSWESELSPTDNLHLSTRADDTWTEHWFLTASPVWNVSLSGLSPVFQPDNQDLIPAWHPWPGETVDLSMSRPDAVSGATVTIRKARHEMTPGNRQRNSQLDLQLQCSLGEDFILSLPQSAEITSLTHNNRPIPVRKEGGKLVIPLRPGEQSVSIQWKGNVPLDWHSRVDEIGLPVESANITTVLNVPESRWVLWAHGPQRGPAVRFWGILLCSLLAAWALSRPAGTPLRPFEWMLLAVGLTQIHLLASLLVVGWLFFLAWRGRTSFQKLSGWAYNLLQVLLILLTATVLGIFINIVAAGLLGNPEMFIQGNDSSCNSLQWYQAHSDNILPQPGCLSVSIWWYRFLMLAWALWLAASLIRWLKWAWEQFSSGGAFRGRHQAPVTPPPVPKSA